MTTGHRFARRALLFALCGVAAPLAAQTGASDAGTFDVRVGGRSVGTEEFTIQQSGAGSNSEIVASGRVNLLLTTGSLELSPRLRTTGFQADPVAYDVTVGGTSPRRIVGSVGGGRVTSRIVTPTGEQLREYLASAGAIVLDDGVAHHYYFLARRVRNGRAPIIIPRENRQVMATVEDLGEDRVQVGDTSANLFHLMVRPDGGEVRHVWVDALGRVIRVEIPDRDYVALRTELPV